MLWKGNDQSCEEDIEVQGLSGEEDIRGQSWGSKQC